MAWWWPFGRKSREPVQAWLNKYDRWLDGFQGMLAEFPDHTELEGAPIGEAEGSLLDDITDLYGEDLREVAERMVLKGELLRARVHKRLGAGR